MQNYFSNVAYGWVSVDPSYDGRQFPETRTYYKVIKYVADSRTVSPMPSSQHLLTIPTFAADLLRKRTNMLTFAFASSLVHRVLYDQPIFNCRSIRLTFSCEKCFASAGVIKRNPYLKLCLVLV